LEKRLLAKMRSNPRDWTIADVQKLCRDEGLIFTPPNKSSHAKAAHELVRNIVTVPATD
jgi:hypothetical protein